MRLFLATGNIHKVAEVRAFLSQRGSSFEVESAAAVGGMPAVVEDADTFAGNALRKATAFGRLLRRMPDIAAPWCVVADDSGLCVDQLDGAPGVRSARFAGENATDLENTSKLLRLLEGKTGESRSAAFQCHLAVVNSDEVTVVFEGRCAGTIIDSPRGVGGFGYDPVFVPEGFDLSFAQLPEETKNRISHRARALEQMLKWLGASS